METKKIAIESIKLILGKKEIILTVDELRKLKTELDNIFGECIIHYNSKWWYQYPYVPNNPTYQPFIYSSSCVSCDGSNQAIVKL